MELRDKVCLITGGSGGIGSATALQFASLGAHISVGSLEADKDAALRLKSQIESLGRKCTVFLGNVGDPAQVLNLVQGTVQTFGGVDVLVHCAGGPVPGSLTEVDPKEWYKAFDVHVHAAFHLCRAVVPYMIKKHEGAIVLISSAAGLRGCAGAIAYGVVKGAILPLTRTLARELAEHNIRVSCVSPGIIRTRFQDILTPEQVRNNIENRIPLRREGKPEDVARVIAMLVQNDFITGENITIDGGMTMRVA